MIKACVCTVLAYFIAAISPTMDVANGALPAWIVINLFFVGLLIRPQDQPRYWHWCGPPPFTALRFEAQAAWQCDVTRCTANPEGSMQPGSSLSPSWSAVSSGYRTDPD